MVNYFLVLKADKNDRTNRYVMVNNGY